jgi:multidrug efflux pump subunit AcrA (membrane-fusion protein)
MFTQEIKRSRSKRPLFIGIVLVVIVAAVVLLVPIPRTLKTHFVLQPGATTEVHAPRDGVLVEVVTTDGALVAKGSVIAKYDVSTLEQQIADLEKSLAALEEKKGRPAPPKVRAAVGKAEAALKAAEAALAKATKAGKTPMAAATKKRDAAASALEKLKASAGPAPEVIEQELATSREALTALQTQLLQATMVSPATGVLTLSGVEKGSSVKAGAKLGVVDDVTKLKAVVDVPTGETVGKGQSATLLLDDGKRRVMFDAEAKGETAEILFDNSRGELKAGAKGDAELDGTPRSVLAR